MATAASAAPALGVAVPEAAVLALPTDDDGRLAGAAGGLLRDEVDGVDAVLVGPGLQGPDAVVTLLRHVIPHVSSGIVLDALASAFVAEQPDDVPTGAVLTLNPSELDHLGLGGPAEAAARTGAVVVRGGTETHVAAPDGRGWVVRGGGPGLASSGSGDVQAGLV